MKHPSRTLAVLAAALAAALPRLSAEKIDLTRVTPVPETQPVPLQDFFRPALFTGPQINPSGTHIAALVTAGTDEYRLLIYDMKKNTLESLGGTGDKDIFGFRWLTDKRLLFQMSSLKYYNLGMFAVETGNLNHPYPLLQFVGARLVSIPQATPEFPVVWMSYDAADSEQDLGPATVNTITRVGAFINLHDAGVRHDDFLEVRDSNERHIQKTLPALKLKDAITSGYLADKTGTLAFGFSAKGGYTSLHYLEKNDWKKSPIDLEDVDIYAAGNQPGEILTLGPGAPGQPSVLQLVDVRTGTPGTVLFQDKGYDFDGELYRDPATRDIVGLMYDRAGPQTVWLTDKYRDLQKVIDSSFPGVVAQIMGSNLKETIFLVRTYSDRQPPIYYYVNLETRSLALLKNSRPWIDPKRMRPISMLRYKTRDGKQLDAYVTMPAGATKENPAPLVVLPHGGPWVRDTWGFDGEAQFLASRGYAVLQPNYRGSPGYSWMFPIEDQWDFVKMHEDVTDATNTLVKSGLVDRNRIAIMGGSFGGYLAVSGVTREPGLYRCAVTIAGVFDWSEMVRNEKYYQFDSPWYARMIRKLGDPATAREKFDRISPIKAVANIKVPVFVAHGKDDTVVSIVQSKMLISQLKAHDVAYEAFLVGGEDHGMGHLENEVELYSRIEAFLAKNLGR